MFLLLVLLVLSLIFLKGIFRIIIPILLFLLALRLFFGIIFFLLSPSVLVPALVIALIVWIATAVKQRRQ